jgi:hypothetical protein
LPLVPARGAEADGGVIFHDAAKCVFPLLTRGATISAPGSLPRVRVCEIIGPLVPSPESKILGSLSLGLKNDSVAEVFQALDQDFLEVVFVEPLKMV